MQVDEDPPPPMPGLPFWNEVNYTAHTKVAPEPEEFEMYNLDEDPRELINCYGDPAYAQQQQQLAQLLDDQRTQKRLTPCSGAVPGQDCNPWGECAGVCSE